MVLDDIPIHPMKASYAYISAPTREQPSHPSNTRTSQSGIARPRSSNNPRRLVLSWSGRERSDHSDPFTHPLTNALPKRWRPAKQTVDIWLCFTRLCPMSAASSKSRRRSGSLGSQDSIRPGLFRCIFEHPAVGAAYESTLLMYKTMRVKIEDEKKGSLGISSVTVKTADCFLINSAVNEDPSSTGKPTSFGTT